jgi:hypothetical protein
MNTRTKIARGIILFFALLVLSIFFAYIENYPNQLSPYDFGAETGIVLRHMLEIIGMLALFALAFRLFKKND